MLYFIFFVIIEPILVVLKIEYRLSRRLANYRVAYEETKSNRVSDFRDLVRSLFPKAIFFLFFIYMAVYGQLTAFTTMMDPEHTDDFWCVHASLAEIWSSDVQDKIFRRKRLRTGANFVHVYIEIWNKGILKFNKFSV